MKQKFFVCEKCGNIISFVKNTGAKVTCCNQEMREIIAGETDAAGEKHVPVIKQEGNKVTVTVGEVHHPMTEAHLIDWITLVTKEGRQFKKLEPGKEPEAIFMITDTDEVVGAKAYCNLHSLYQSS